MTRATTAASEGLPMPPAEVAPEPARPAPPTLTHGTLRVSVHGRDGDKPGPVHRQRPGLVESGMIKPGNEVVVFNTGSLEKYLPDLQHLL